MKDPRELVSAYFDDALSDAGFVELRNWLSEDARHVQIFVRESVVHSRLHDILVQEDVCGLVFDDDADYDGVNPRHIRSLLDEEDAAAARRAREAEEQSRREAATSRSGELLDRSLLRIDRSPAHRWTAYITMGAAAALLFFLGRMLSSPAPPASGPNGEAVGQGAEVVLARVAKSVAASWSDASVATSPGTGLTRGRFALSTGVVELRFDAGARLVVEAPAELELTQPNAGVIHRGRVVAHVPEQAVGFTLRSRGANFVDLGTEFGLEVSAAGESNVHVLEGEIALVPSNRQGDAPPSRTLQAGAASFVSADGTAVASVPFDQTKFIRRVPKSAYQLAVLQSRPLVYWNLDEPRGEPVVQSVGRLPAPGVLSPGVLLGGKGVHGPSSRAAIFVAKHEGIDFGACRDLARTADLTVEAWAFSKRTTTGPQRIFSTFDRPPRSGFGFGLVDGPWYRLASDKTFLHVTSHGAYDCVSTAEVPAGQWVHLAAVVQPDGEPQLYVNGQISDKRFRVIKARRAAVGVEEDEEHDPAHEDWFVAWRAGMQGAGGSGASRIGRNPPGADGRCATERFEGLLSDVAVFDRALAAQEIQRHYEASLR